MTLQTAITSLASSRGPCILLRQMQLQLGHLPKTHLEENHSECVVVFDTNDLRLIYEREEYRPLNQMLDFDTVFYILITTFDSSDIWNAIDDELCADTTTHTLSLINKNIYSFGCEFKDWLARSHEVKDRHFYEVINTNGSVVVTQASCNATSLPDTPGLF